MATEKSIFPILNNRILRHGMFWMCYVLIFGLLYGEYGDNYFYYFKESLYMLPFMMIAAYVINYGILPRYLKSRRFLLIVGAFLSVFVVVILQRITLRLVNELEVKLEKLFDLTFLYMFLETSFMVGAAIVIKLIKKSVEQQQEKLEVEKSNLQTELKLLKAQIQPHFLFNQENSSRLCLGV